MSLRNCHSTNVRVRITFLTMVVVVCLSLAGVNYICLDSLMVHVSYQLSRHMYPDSADIAIVPLKRWNASAPSVTVRSVYFDDRHRYSRRNSSVFMIEVRKVVLENGLLVGCQVGSSYTVDMKVHSLNVNGWFGNYIDEKPYLSHTMAMVDCFDISAENGSKAAIWYKNVPNGILLPAESEDPFMIPVFQYHPNNSRPRIAACLAPVYGQPPWIEQWLLYQHTIGIDHVHMIADETYDGLSGPNVKEALEVGFLSLDVWKSNDEVHYYSQLLAYHDCVYRFRGAFDYMFFADQDDFFVPLVPGKTTLNSYVNEWCFKSSCAFEWIEYYPDCGMQKEETSDGNLTMMLKSNVHKRTHMTKCLHYLPATTEIGIHDARELTSGLREIRVPRHIAYVAHLRKFRKPKGGKCN